MSGKLYIESEGTDLQAKFIMSFSLSLRYK